MLDMVHSNELMKGSSKTNTDSLLQFSRQHLKAMMAHYTGHCRLRVHMHRIGMVDDAECRWCIEDDESAVFRFWTGSTPTREHLDNILPKKVIQFLEELKILSEIWPNRWLCVIHNRRTVAVEGSNCPLTYYITDLMSFYNIVVISFRQLKGKTI